MFTRPRFLELTALALILILAAYLRLANVATNPAWYTDEGTHLDIARHLLNGHIQYLAIDQSWLLFSRLPLFEMLLAVLAYFNGVSMETLRILTSSLGVATVSVLYFVVRRVTHDRALAWLAALLLAIYPSAALYSRFGFSYNLLAPLVSIAFLGAYEYATHRSRRWLAVAALSIGLGAISDLWMFVLVAPLMLIVPTRNWRDTLWSLPLVLLPFGLYTALMLLTIPQAFTFDLSFVLSRLNQIPVSQQMATLWQNITTLGTQDVWMILGAIGLLLLKPPRFRWIALMFFVIPIMLLGRTTALFNLSFYYLIPLLPFIALGVASFMWYGASGLANRFGPQSSRRVMAVLGTLLALAVLLSTSRLIEQVRAGFRTDIDGFLIDPGAARAASSFVNQHIGSNDLVIGSPPFAWMLQANIADMQMPIAYRGQATPHLPGDMPSDRWAFDPSYERARFVIVDNLWRNWAVPNVPGVADMLREVAAWPIVLRSGEVVVYRNPEER